MLEPWIQGENKGLQEYTLEEETKNEMQPKSEKMLLPTYFQDLFLEFGDLNNFDLKDVIYEKSEQERFMKAVKEQIEQK